MIILHVWILHARFKTDFEDGGREVQNELFEILWAETLLRLRNEGLSAMRENKVLGQFQNVSFGAMLEYDAAFAVTDDQEYQFGSALWRYGGQARSRCTFVSSCDGRSNVFDSQPVPDAHVLKLAQYVRREVANIHKVRDSTDFWYSLRAHARNVAAIASRSVPWLHFLGPSCWRNAAPANGALGPVP